MKFVTFSDSDRVYRDGLKKKASSYNDTRFSIMEKARKADRALTDGEMDDIETLNLKHSKVSAEIAELDAQEMAALRDDVSKVRDSDIRASVAAGGSHVVAYGGGRGQIFESFGDQLAAIVKAANPSERPDERLYQVAKLAASGSNEGVGSEGAFLVEPTFASEIVRQVFDTGQVAQRCKKWAVGPNSNGVKLPILADSSRANGSRWGGLQTYRTSEAGTVTATKPTFGQLAIQLEKLMGLAYVTEELLQDRQQLGAFLMQGFSEELAFKLDDELINGTGTGQCLGLLNAPALVSVAKEAQQTQSTLVPANLSKMWSRMPARNRKSAVWFCNQDIESQLFSLSLVVGSGGTPVFLPSGGLSEQPFSTLFGRPVVPIEQAATLGSKGDVILADMSQYLLIERPPQADVSMHVRFLFDEQTFRVTWRVNGAPIWTAPLTPYKGSNTLSPFVTLDARG